MPWVQLASLCCHKLFTSWQQSHLSFEESFAARREILANKRGIFVQCCCSLEETQYFDTTEHFLVRRPSLFSLLITTRQESIILKSQFCEWFSLTWKIHMRKHEVNKWCISRKINNHVSQLVICSMYRLLQELSLFFFRPGSFIFGYKHITGTQSSLGLKLNH